MPIAKVFFGMSLKRDEVLQPQAVVVVEEKDVGGEKGIMEQEDVKAGRRRRVGGGAGKMRLRGKLGGRKVHLEEASLDRETKKLERKQMALAKRLSRLEMKKSGKAGIDAGKGSKRSRSAQNEKREKKDRSQSRKEKKSSGFIKNRREAKKARTSESTGILKVEVSVEEKLAKKEARQAEREAKKMERLLNKEERKAKKEAPKNPYRPKIRVGKLVKAPKAFRAMQRAAQRR